jgi:hypothetical protein
VATSGELSTTTKVALASIAAGAALGALGLAFGGVFNAGAVVAFGVAAIIGGVDSVRTRTHRTSRSGTSASLRIMHTGPSAVIYGVGFIAVGTTLAVAGIAWMIGQGDELWAAISDRPGLVGIAAGAGITLMGGATAISQWTYEDHSTVWWQRIPGMAVGAILMAIGALVFALGFSLTQDPPTSDNVFERIADTLIAWTGFE